jgi:predicted ferric reductase
VTLRPAFESSVVVTRPTVPLDRGLGIRRTLIWVSLGVAFAATVAMWWFGTPAGAVNGRTGVVLAAGRIVGLMAGFVLLVEILLMARLRWIESCLGSYELFGWRRALGVVLVVLAAVHAVLVVFAYSLTAKRRMLGQIWSMLTTMEGLLAAALALTLLSLAALFVGLGWNRVEAGTWGGFNTCLCGVLFLAYGHQFALGTTVVRQGWPRWYWVGLHLFVLWSLLWGRVLRPALFNARHEFRVVAAASEVPGWASLDIGGRRMEWVRAELGQRIRCRFLTAGGWWWSCPLVVSSVPNGTGMRVRLPAFGQYLKLLRHLEVGVGVLLSEPSGRCTADRRVMGEALVIVGGAGAVSVSALLGELPAGTVVLCHGSSEAELVFREELERVALERRATVRFVIGKRDDPVPSHAFSPVGLRELVPDLAERDVFVLGPGWLLRRSTEAMRRLGVAPRQVHVETVEF